jgi:NAD-specific glutamate dehydrogenase
VRSLREILDESLGSLERERHRRQAESLEADGLPAGLALEIARLPWLVGALSVVSLVVRCGTSLPRAVGVYTRIAAQTGIAWLLDRLGHVKHLDSWDRGAAEALYLEVCDVHRRLTESVISESDEATRRIGLSDAKAGALRQIEETIREIEADDRAGVGALTVLAQQIRRLV